MTVIVYYEMMLKIVSKLHNTHVLNTIPVRQKQRRKP